MLGRRKLTEAILAWYDRHRRDLPWRAKMGSTADPYAVWLSEIMLQQTTVAAVKPFYAAFLQRWPTVSALAAAPLDDVLKLWAGLGYYSRARNLHACAQLVETEHGGVFPAREEQLRRLPGVGAYTAAAVAAIAFDQRAVVVDGNVERVMARLEAVDTPLPRAKSALRTAMDGITPTARCGDFAQAVMDLGATICTPRKPACILCPLMAACKAAMQRQQERYPVKAPKAEVPQRSGAVFIVVRPDGALLVRQRPPKGLFGGMTEFPGTAWSPAFSPDSLELPPGIVGPLVRLGTVEHGLTHFTLTLHVFLAKADTGDLIGMRWADRVAIAGEALPTLMRKVHDVFLATRATSG